MDQCGRKYFNTTSQFFQNLWLFNMIKKAIRYEINKNILINILVEESSYLVGRDG